IFDEQDRSALIEDVLSHQRERIEAEESARHAACISRWKNLFTTADQAMAAAVTDDQRTAAWLYAEYDRVMKSYNAVDFDDLILLPVMLFAAQPEILDKWRNRIRYLLVDEYQDTNATQYQLVKQLAGTL